jgi:hypothetical protein
MAFLFPNLFPPYVGCLPQIANGDIEMPLADAMALVWKAKKLQFTVSYSATAHIIVDGEDVGVLTNTLNGYATIFRATDSGPIQKMSDIICDDSYETVFENGTNFFSGSFFGNFSFAGAGDEGELDFTTFGFSPLSVKTVGENKVCDFEYNFFLDPRGRNVYSNFMVSAGSSPPGSNPSAIIPSGAIVTVNGNTHSTALYFKPDDTMAGEGVSFDSVTATGQISVAIQSERLAE